MRRLCVVAVGVGILGGARSSQGGDLPGISLRWLAPAACPGAEDVRARVQRLLPHDFAGAGNGLLAEAAVEATRAHGYRLTLRVSRRGATGRATRVFESDSCESLAGAAAVTLALLAHEPRLGEGTEPGAAAPSSAASTATPSASQGPSPPADSTPASAPSTPAPAPPSASGPAPSTPVQARPASLPAPSAPAPAPPPAPGPKPAPRIESETQAPLEAAPSAVSGWALEAPIVAVDQGTLPSAAYGFGAAVGFRANRVRLMLTGLVWVPQDSSGAGVYTSSYDRRSGELSACYGWPIGTFDFGPCATLTLEDVSAHGTGPEIVGADGHATWLTIGVAARAGWSIQRWAHVFLRPHLALTTSRPTFAIDGVGSLYQVPLVSAGVDLGCEWIL
ncbi:MAG TPA: hypothetical protein VK841_08115 [Polyangiaceae bacterium]|nr:hypothetical protein [Polyangiaceae bacterium]